MRVASGVRAFIATVAALPPPLPSAAATLSPSTPWHLDYAITQCAAGREYGVGDHAITLVIRPTMNGQIYDVIVKRNTGGPKFAEEIRGSVNFGNGPVESWVLHYGDRKMSIDQFRLWRSDIVKGRTAATITLSSRDQYDQTFTLSAMSPLLDGLDKCIDDLASYWNYGKAATVAKPASGDVRGLFSADDFPLEAIRRDQEGSTQFFLLIDEHGGVAGCQLAASSGNPVFDLAACNVLRERAHFAPALDVHNQPVRSMVCTPPIVFRIQDTLAKPPPDVTRATDLAGICPSHSGST